MTNKPNPHKVFQTQEDHLKWDKYVEQIDLINLTNKQKNDALEAIQYLRELLGENFLRRCWQHRHPFLFRMFNSAPVSRLELTRFAESLKDLSFATGFDEWVKKFKKTKEPEKFTESETVLENAHKFRRAGFDIEFEPRIQVKLPSGQMRDKNPDLKITNPQNGEEIFVEVSQMKSSDDEVKSSETFYLLWRLIHRAIDENTVIESDKSGNTVVTASIYPYVKILRGLDSKELEQVTKEITFLIETVKQTQKFQTLVIEDKVEIAVAPLSEQHKAEQWAKDRKMTNFVESPLVPMRETQRARIKIADKIKQLPENKPGIIIIPAGILMFYAYALEYILLDLESEMEKFPQLLFVSLYSHVGEGKSKNSTTDINDHLFIETMINDLHKEKRIVVRNPNFALRLSKNTLRKIIKAFKI